MATPFSLNTQLSLLLIGRLPWVCTQFYFFRKSIVNSRKVRTKQSMILKKELSLEEEIIFQCNILSNKVNLKISMK